MCNVARKYCGPFRKYATISFLFSSTLRFAKQGNTYPKYLVYSVGIHKREEEGIISVIDRPCANGSDTLNYPSSQNRKIGRKYSWYIFYGSV